MSQRPPSTIVLLGSQRFSHDLRPRVDEVGVSGRIAMITAGWRDRESEDAELTEHLAVDTVNLELWRRANDVFNDDPELAAAHRERQQNLRHKQDFYRIRLEHVLAADHVIRQRQAPEHVQREAKVASIASIRDLDRYHEDQCVRVQDSYREKIAPHERPVVKRHIDELRELLAGCAALTIAGGHVASLMNRLQLFGLGDLIQGQPVFAWAAGAMAICERIVLFHDSPAQGAGASQMFGTGLGWARGVVPLPEPERRLRMDDPERVEVLASRFSPARCIALPTGSWLRMTDGQRTASKGAIELHADGQCTPLGGTA